MEVGEEKDENLPAPLSSEPKAEETKEPQNLGEGTEINNELEQFELTSKKEMSAASSDAALMLIIFLPCLCLFSLLHYM